MSNINKTEGYTEIHSKIEAGFLYVRVEPIHDAPASFYMTADQARALAATLTKLAEELDHV